ncbi:MAG: hypothetical protein HC919_11390 [Oscillatoriales cyanobacterium SM2_2_1]|nr:hypothetical protein [Oscillatoriales cyanobacterium SM2_2_1]
MFQVVLELKVGRRVHVIAEFPTKEQALNRYMELVKDNKDSPETRQGKYGIRAKPTS